MKTPTMNGGFVAMPQEEFEALLEAAAERGAKRALATVGLVDEEAAGDIRDLRSLLGALRVAKHIAWSTIVRLVTTGVLLTLLAGIAIKLKLFGNGS